MTAPTPDAKARNEAARERAATDPQAVADAAMRSATLPETLGLGEGVETRDGTTYVKIRTDLDEAEAEHTAIMRDVAGNLWLRSQLTGRPGLTGFDSRVNAEAICDGLAKLPAGDDLASLTLVVEAMPREVEADRRPIGIMPKFAGEFLAPAAIVEADRERLPKWGPLALVPNKPDGQLWLPNLDSASTELEVPSLLLGMLDAGTLAQPGAGAPLRDRAFVEPLMLAMREVRALGERFYIRDVTVADVVTWLAWNPNRYRPDDDAYGRALKRAIMSANAIEIPLARGGFLLPVFFEAAEGLRLESRVAVSVRLLPGSEHGAGVVRAVLRQAGKVSAVAWRLYLAFCFEWNRIAYKGRVPHLTQPEVLRDKRGRLTSDDERLILITGPDPTWPKKRREATPADRPVTDWRDSRAIEIGREPSPKGESLHRVYDAPRDLVRAAFPLGTNATRANPQRTEVQAVKAVRWLAGEVDLNRQRIAAPGVRIVRLGRATKTGNPHGFPWYIVPPWKP